MLQQWLKSRFRLLDRPGRSARRSARPTLEALEDRTVPAVFTWKAGAAGNWNTPANWLEDGAMTANVPGMNDDVGFNNTSVENSTQNIAGLTIKSLTVQGPTLPDISGYTGTISLDFNLAVTGNVTIGGGTVTGTSILKVENQGSTFTWSGGTISAGTTVGKAGVQQQQQPTLNIEGDAEKTLKNPLRQLRQRDLDRYG